MTWTFTRAQPTQAATYPQCGLEQGREMWGLWKRLYFSNLGRKPDSKQLRCSLTTLQDRSSQTDLSLPRPPPAPVRHKLCLQGYWVISGIQVSFPQDWRTGMESSSFTNPSEAMSIKDTPWILWKCPHEWIVSSCGPRDVFYSSCFQGSDCDWSVPSFALAAMVLQLQSTSRLTLTTTDDLCFVLMFPDFS